MNSPKARKSKQKRGSGPLTQPLTQPLTKALDKAFDKDVRVFSENVALRCFRASACASVWPVLAPVFAPVFTPVLATTLYIIKRYKVNRPLS